MDTVASLSLILPEEILSVSGLVLLLVAAWAGDKAARLISILACVALGAAFFLVIPTVCAGASGPDTVGFFGQYHADAFAGFAKLMIYAASGAALVIAINMVVAILLAHTGQLGSLTNNGGWALELQGMFLFTGLAIAFMGAGRFSLAGNGGRWN